MQKRGATSKTLWPIWGCPRLSVERCGPQEVLSWNCGPGLGFWGPERPPGLAQPPFKPLTLRAPALQAATLPHMSDPNFCPTQKTKKKLLFIDQSAQTNCPSRLAQSRTRPAHPKRVASMGSSCETPAACREKGQNVWRSSPHPYGSHLLWVWASTLRPHPFFSLFHFPFVLFCHRFSFLLSPFG